MTQREELFSESSRRTFLKATAATGVLAGIGGVTAAQEQTFEFDGAIGGWFATAPSSIEGERNPTFELEPGTTYTVRWTNADGFDHNFVIIDVDGNEVFRSEILSEQGETQTVEFTAEENMAEYFCEVHPDTMRGQLSIGGQVMEFQDEEVVPEGDSIGLEPVAEGLTAPLGFEVAEEDQDRRFIVDQTGQIYVHGPDGLQDEPFLDVSDKMVDLGIEELGGYDERGLLGLAFHPDFQNNRRFFIRYSAPLQNGDGGATETTTEGGTTEAGTTEAGTTEAGTTEAGTTEAGEETTAAGTETTAANETTAGGNQTAGTETTQASKAGDQSNQYDHTDILAEYQATEDMSSGDPESERVIMAIQSPQTNHNGGALAFGPDGYLYSSIGDGGAADDVGFGHVEDWYGDNEGGNGQDVTENPLGSILRIDVDNEGENGEPYAIPEDNPLVDGEGLPEHYAWGFRNPWRMSFDSEGRLFVGDAGQNRYEEVDMVEMGGNYGWNVKEGTHCFSTENPAQEYEGDCPDSTPDDVRGGEPLLDPIIEYEHRLKTTAFIDGSVVIGGYVYEGDAVSALDGTYVFGNWSGAGVRDPDGQIFVATPPDESDGGTTTEAGTTEAGTATETEAGTEAGTTTAAATETTAGNETTADGTGTATTESGGQESDELWSVEELVIEGLEGESFGQYVYGFGRDADGELYVLTNGSFQPTGETGKVYRLVPAGEGAQITPAETETETGTEQAGTTTAEGGTETEAGTTTEQGGTTTETGTETGTGGTTTGGAY